MLLECAHHLVAQSEIVLTTKCVSMSSVYPNVPRTTNVLNSMNVEEEFVLLLRNVAQTTTAPLMNLVQQPFPAWDRGSARMFAKALSFVEGMLSASQAIIDPFAPAQMASLAILKMTKLAVRRNCVPQIQIALVTAFAQTSGALLLYEQVAPLTKIVDLMKHVSMGTVSTPVTALHLVASMQFAMFSTTKSNAHVLQDSLAMMKLNVSEFPTPAYPMKAVLEV